MTARLNGQVLPDGWSWAYLSHLGELNRGKSKHRPRNDDRLFGGPYPFIQTSDIRHANGILSSYSQTYSEFGLKQSRLWPAGTLCITIAANIAETAILGFDACFPDSVVGFIASTEACNKQFIEYFFRTVKQDLETFAPATAQKNINLEVLNELAVPLPPLNEQHRIVEVIDAQFTRLDAAVTALKRSQANLKRYRAAVLKAACEGRLVPTEAALAQAEGRSYEPAAVLLERILAERRRKWEAENPKKQYQEPVAPDTSALPELPEGWCWTAANQLCEPIASGSTPSPDKMSLGGGDIPFIKVYNLTFTGRLDFSITPTFISEATHKTQLKRSILIPGDVLMNIVGPPLGKVSIVPDTFPQWNMNQAIVAFRPISTDFNNKFLAHVLMSQSISTQKLYATAKATAGQYNLNVSTCRTMYLPLPPYAEQQRIVTEVERRLSLIDQLEKIIEADLARANRLRQSILKRAFEGKLVPQDPNDEPAAVLLERLRT